jgi:hypothetical protein
MVLRWMGTRVALGRDNPPFAVKLQRMGHPNGKEVGKELVDVALVAFLLFHGGEVLGGVVEGAV